MKCPVLFIYEDGFICDLWLDEDESWDAVVAVVFVVAKSKSKKHGRPVRVLHGLNRPTSLYSVINMAFDLVPVITSAWSDRKEVFEEQLDKIIVDDPRIDGLMCKMNFINLEWG
jgi:hypothetical protein